MGQKDLKMGQKCLGLVWFGLVWLCCEPNWSELTPKILTASCSDFQSSSQTPRNQTFNFAILDNLKKVLNSAMTQDHNLAIPNHTIPNQDILGLFLGVFGPFLGRKISFPQCF